MNKKSGQVVVVLMISGITFIGSLITFAASRSQIKKAEESLAKHEEEMALQVTQARANAEREHQFQEKTARERGEQIDLEQKRLEQARLQREAQQDAAKQEREERLRLQQEARDKNADRRQTQEEGRRKTLEKLKAERERRPAIQNDHDVIQNFINLNLTNNGPITIKRWFDPLRASSKGLEGSLYRVVAQTSAATVTPDGRVKNNAVTINLYFFMGEGAVQSWQASEQGYKSVKICQIIDSIPGG